eukprot:snap_masked-scaffold1846_size26495-processed-gene-0.2 protein:Tk03904 transcript:snap_masked-scaffold1846_size26495-processed-gene-0.2-mRNA-1 annotation:"hexosaminidase domain-containing protein"
MPDSICPCHHEAMDLIEEMIDQIMSIHKDHSFAMSLDDIQVKSEPEITAVALKLPVFSSEASDRRFFLAKAKCRLGKNTITKHDYVLASLPPELLASIPPDEACINADDPYR